jgi:hypothetical protein
MTKAVRELSVIFDRKEVASVEYMRLAMYRSMAILHFVKNEGMSVEEADRRVMVDLDSLHSTVLVTELEDGSEYLEVLEVRVDVDVLEEKNDTKQSDKEKSDKSA